MISVTDENGIEWIDLSEEFDGIDMVTDVSQVSQGRPCLEREPGLVCLDGWNVIF